MARDSNRSTVSKSASRLEWGSQDRLGKVVAITLEKELQNGITSVVTSVQLAQFRQLAPLLRQYSPTALPPLSENLVACLRDQARSLVQGQAKPTQSPPA